MSDDKTLPIVPFDQVEREAAALRRAIETSDDKTAQSTYAVMVDALEGPSFSTNLVLEVMPEAYQGPGPHDHYSLTLTNGFETFYRAADSGRAQADVFYTLEEIVRLYPGRDWRPL